MSGLHDYAILQNERLYTVVETTLGTMALFAPTSAQRFTRASLDWQAAILTPNNKTGTRSQSRYAKGRRKGTWSVEMDLAGSGAAGTAPDADPYWQAAFGAAGVTGTGTYTYSLSDALVSLSIAAYKNNPTTLNHHISFGALLREMRLAFGEDFSKLTCSGDAWWTVDSTSFASATTTEKGGQPTFPLEPATQTYHGSEIVGFTGAITIAGNVIAEIRSGTVIISTGNSPIEDTFGSYYPNGAYGTRRNVSLDIDSYDTDSDGMNALRQNALTQTPVSASFQFGTIAGNILTITAGQCLLPSPKSGENSDRFTNQFQGVRCLASADASKDEITARWS